MAELDKATQTAVADALLKGGKRIDVVEKTLETVTAKMAAIEADAKETREIAKRNATTPPKASPISLGRALRALKLGDWSDAKVEREAMLAAYAERARWSDAVRAMNITNDAQGGFSVNESQEPGIIEMLKAQSVVLSSGPLQMNGLTTSPVKLVRQTGAATHSWVAELTAGSESTPTIDQITLTPHKSMIIVGLSNEQIMLGEAGESFVRQDLTEQMSLGEDLGFLNGSGGGSAPLGMLQKAGINTVAFGGGVTIDKLFEMIYELEVDNIRLAKPTWFMHPLVWHDLRVLKDGEGRYLLDHATKTLLGFPYKLSTQMTIPTGAATTGALALVDMAQIIVATWGGLDFLPSKEATVGSVNAYSQDLTWLRVTRHVDIQARHPEAICTSTGLTT